MDYPYAYLPPYDWNQLSEEITSEMIWEHHFIAQPSFWNICGVGTIPQKKLNQKKINDNLFILILNSVIDKRSNKICSTMDNLIFTDEEPFGYDPLSICIYYVMLYSLLSMSIYVSHPFDIIMNNWKQRYSQHPSTMKL